mmetsp:Transcript_11353/g.30357  ORF Transcript_11353/g.30357 Transcript_11353/m.30357 type:complete len:260 (-) Transcript_11353:573-1352(-)
MRWRHLDRAGVAIAHTGLLHQDDVLRDPPPHHRHWRCGPAHDGGRHANLRLGRLRRCPWLAGRRRRKRRWKRRWKRRLKRRLRRRLQRRHDRRLNRRRKRRLKHVDHLRHRHPLLDSVVQQRRGDVSQHGASELRCLGDCLVQHLRSLVDGQVRPAHPVRHKLARHHLGEDQPQGPRVVARVLPLAARRLWRRVWQVDLAARNWPVDALRAPEVGEDDPRRWRIRLPRHEHVLRPHVPVDETLGVHGRQRARQLREHQA